MADVPAKSCRIYIRYGSGSTDSMPTADDIKEIFSVHGNIVDVDRRAKFCFVEYDTEASAEKAVSTENRHDFKGIKLQVEIAMGARKVRNTNNDSSSTASAGTEKKSSFSTDKWMAQREAAKKIPVEVPKQDKVTVSDGVGQVSAVSSSSSARQSTGPAWTTSRWKDTRKNSTCLSAEAVKQPQSHRRQSRSRSRSPLTNAKSSVQTHGRISNEQRSQHSQMDQLRRLEAELEEQSKRLSVSSKTSAKQSAYVTEAKYTTYQPKSYDRELPQSVASSSSGSNTQQPLKSALRQTSTYGKEEDLSSKIRQYQQLARNVDHTLSQMKNSSKQFSSKYDDARDTRVESNFDNTRRDGHMDSAHHTTSAAGTQCEIFINSTSLGDYAKQVAVRIDRIGLRVHISVLSADIMDEVSDVMTQGCLYALSITGPQSNLYILHGEPEEHRNMLIEDALQMIAKNYANYCRVWQIKQSSGGELSSSSLPMRNAQSASATMIPMANAQPASVTTPQLVAERLQPDTATRRLIGMLSADCELTHNELEHIISYLRFRQKALVSAPAFPSNSGSSHEAGRTDREASSSRSSGNAATDLDFVNCLLMEAAKLASRR